MASQCSSLLCFRNEIHVIDQMIVSNLVQCAPPLEVAVLFDWNLSRYLVLFGHVVNLDLLLCTGFINEHLICLNALL